MEARRILGRDQQEEQMRGAAVERVEVHAALMAAEDADNAVNSGEFAVGYRDTVADRGRAEPLTFG